MVFSVPDIILIICYGLIFICGTIGNIFVISWFGASEKRGKAGSKLVIVLAINDFLSSIFVPIYQIHFIIRFSLVSKDAKGVLGAFFTRSSWYVGKTLCHLDLGIQSVFITATALLLIVISIERYR